MRLTDRLPDPADPVAVRGFWDSRAHLGARAGTNDVLLKRLEIDYLAGHVAPGQCVLDVGCGTAETLMVLGERCPAVYCLRGWDASARMVAAARTRLRTRPADAPWLEVRRIDIERRRSGASYDLVYTERLLINLGTWPRQHAAIRTLGQLVQPGGSLVLAEHSQDALDRLNALRAAVALPSITPPWHNRYLREAEVTSLDGQDGLHLERVDHFTSTYYFLSRVVNAWWAARTGRAPRYDALVNRLALHLPPVGTVGQCVGWVFRREGQEG